MTREHSGKLWIQGNQIYLAAAAVLVPNLRYVSNPISASKMTLASGNLGWFIPSLQIDARCKQGAGMIYIGTVQKLLYH